ncbi:hypothetical protein QSE00_19105 [Arenibacter sp. M-2]|uniref:hypothetical protein n=1 Tax=Arenibacter sp. M-2 TaxID=3053612 RepID=UPI0025709939|nr:hypothetical protein [Arenibacter sp. M-2]MDL5513935.1 hypothetical protein [Arenibacter sp. M-2]|tara:strand:+ start:314 stop:532 length:219 start_codon:yes stop_codon:yes gene_type:complete
MLKDGFSSHKYSDILDHLRENGFLSKEDVAKLLKEYTTYNKITFDCITKEKSIIVGEALIDNYHRTKSKQIV